MKTRFCLIVQERPFQPILTESHPDRPNNSGYIILIIGDKIREKISRDEFEYGFPPLEDCILWSR